MNNDGSRHSSTTELARIDQQIVGLLTGRLRLIEAYRDEPRARQALYQALGRTAEAWAEYADDQHGTADVARLMGEHAELVYDDLLRFAGSDSDRVVALRRPRDPR